MSVEKAGEILVLLDGIQFPILRPGEPPVFNYSHDKNAFQFAHECIRLGYTVYMTSAQAPHDTRSNVRVRSAYPLWEPEDVEVPTDAIDPDMVVCVFPDAMNVRHIFPRAKIISIIPALHWVEDPGLFSGSYTVAFIEAARYSIDYFVTQNERMKQILKFMVHFLAKFPYDDRILVAPQGIVEEIQVRSPDRDALRAEIEVAPDDIMIVNSGGIWKWTDFNTFFEAFCEYSLENPNHRFRLFIMGIVQEFNVDHTAYTDVFRATVERYRETLGDKLTLFEDWNAAGKVVQDYTAIADIGLNVSQDTLEAWQSYRMRFLDYLYFGIPAINTQGDENAARHPDALFVSRPGDKESYKEIFREITKDPSLLRQKKERMKQLSMKYDSKANYGELIRKLAVLPKRPERDFESWEPCVVDVAKAQQANVQSALVERKEQEIVIALEPGDVDILPSAQVATVAEQVQACDPDPPAPHPPTVQVSVVPPREMFSSFGPLGRYQKKRWLLRQWRSAVTNRLSEISERQHSEAVGHLRHEEGLSRIVTTLEELRNEQRRLVADVKDIRDAMK